MLLSINCWKTHHKSNCSFLVNRYVSLLFYFWFLQAFRENRIKYRLKANYHGFLIRHLVDWLSYCSYFEDFVSDHELFHLILHENIFDVLFIQRFSFDSKSRLFSSFNQNNERLHILQYTREETSRNKNF